jgi:hypothetical protein
MAVEQSIPLQTDTVSTLPGGGVRTVLATVLIGGVPTTVQMQVVSLADESGRLIDLRDLSALARLDELCSTLRRCETILAHVAGLPDIGPPCAAPSTPRLS